MLDESPNKGMELTAKSVTPLAKKRAREAPLSSAAHAKRYMPFVILLMSAVIVWASVAEAQEVATETFSVSSIQVLSQKIQILRHDSILLGLSCRSGKVADIEIPSGKLSLGDTIRYEDHSFSIGVIEVTKYNKDFSWQGELMAKKGDVDCVVASHDSKLPHDDDCDAEWARIKPCLVLRP